jgi:hypothetical protein
MAETETEELPIIFFILVILILALAFLLDKIGWY